MNAGHLVPRGPRAVPPPPTTSRAWRLSFAALAACTTFVAAGPAFAANCSSLPAPIYGLGGTSPKPLLAQIATALTNATPPQTFVYQSPGQCLGIDALIGGTTITGTASYWDATGKETTCTLDTVGNTVQVGVMNSTAALCPEVGPTLPPGIGDFTGPIQAFDFVVPHLSTETSISAAAAYFVYGFGAAGNVSPWTQDAFIFKRGTTSGVALFVALALGMPVDKLKGTDAGSSSNMVSDVANSTNVPATIGIVGDESAAAAAGTLNVLAYQHFGQSCGYWPSSTQTAFDKRNVRDGQYYLWSAMHFFAKTDNTGKPSDPGAKKFIGYFTGDVTPPSGVDMTALEIKAGSIPDCAMESKRTTDLGPIQSYAPAEPCGCFFEATATGTTTCTACPNGNECTASAPNCRHGYCEVN